MLLSRAKSGARGKAATKMVVKPNCKTETQAQRSFTSQFTSVIDHHVKCYGKHGCFVAPSLQNIHITTQ